MRDNDEMSSASCLLQLGLSRWPRTGGPVSVPGLVGSVGAVTLCGVESEVLGAVAAHDDEGEGMKKEEALACTAVQSRKRQLHRGSTLRRQNHGHQISSSCILYHGNLEVPRHFTL